MSNTPRKSDLIKLEWVPREFANFIIPQLITGQVTLESHFEEHSSQISRRWDFLIIWSFISRCLTTTSKITHKELLKDKLRHIKIFKSLFEQNQIRTEQHWKWSGTFWLCCSAFPSCITCSWVLNSPVWFLKPNILSLWLPASLSSQVTSCLQSQVTSCFP